VTGSRSVIGVDFGTSTSLVAEKVGAGRTEVFALGTDTSWVPSVAASTTATSSSVRTPTRSTTRSAR
jgi:molecular chaperone DnaK (HSP70)